MSFFKPQSLWAKYFVASFFGILLASLAYFSSEGDIQKHVIRLRDIAQAVFDANKHLANLNRHDVAELKKEILATQCLNQDKVDRKEECPYLDVPYGDSSQDSNPYFGLIPKGAKTVVEIQCNPKDGKFYTDVYFENICPNRCAGGRCQPQRTDCFDKLYFKNPYDADGVGPLSEKPTRWLTSPGKFNELDFSHFQGRSGKRDAQVSMDNTGGTVPFNSNNILLNEHYVVKGNDGQRSAEWAGTSLTNTILLDTLNGIFIHGSPHVTGFGESKGCIRLEPMQQKGLFDLLRRVGTKNVQFSFSGYGDYNEKLGGPDCSAQDEDEWKLAMKGVRPKRRVVTQQDIDQSQQQSCHSLEFFAGIWRGLQGRCQWAQRDQSFSPQDTVQ